jgi:hypothetical protein
MMQPDAVPGERMEVAGTPFSEDGLDSSPSAHADGRAAEGGVDEGLGWRVAGTARGLWMKRSKMTPCR